MLSPFFFSLFDSSLLAAVAYFSFLQFCPKIASALFSFFVFSPVIQRQAERGEWFEFQFFLTMIALFCVFAMIYFLMYRPWRNKLCAAEKTNWLVIVQIGCFFIICAVLRIVMGMVSEGFC